MTRITIIMFGQKLKRDRNDIEKELALRLKKVNRPLIDCLGAKLFD